MQHIVVLGGGSAGWITAATLAAEWAGAGPDARRITLIESPDLPAIGVGEGTWPTMRGTLAKLGLTEADLVQRCDAAFKQGSRFDGWANGSPADRYYHPFTVPVGYGEADLVGAWQATQSQQPFAESVGPQPHLCNAALAPKQVASPEFSGATNYGYHFDAVKMGLLLRQHAIDKLGVRHVADDVIEVQSAENGDIAALLTKAHGAIAGDLFIDCSGLHARLIGKHFAIGFLNQRDVLFNDSALAVQVPYASQEAPLASATIATAYSEGWTWDIGLPTRRGVGMVFSSQHTSAEAAEARLRDHLSRTGASVDIPSPRLIRFEPGYREQFWHRNCVAVGLASGFIEPLEASALAMVELSAAAIRDELPATRADMDIVAKRFNATFSYRWARIIEFLKLHYVLSRRDDSDYWRDHRLEGTQPERLRELLQLWRHRAPSRLDFDRIEEVFPAASYQYVLYGMGFHPEPLLARPERLAAAQGYLQQAATVTRRMLGGMPRHRDLINHIRAHGMSKA